MAVRLSGPERAQIPRLLRSPRWVALTSAVVLLCLGFFGMSRWQWQRAQDQIAADQAALAAPAPLSELVPPGSATATDALGRMASVQGRWVEQLRIPGRLSADGRAGDWIVGALDDGAGQVVIVLRGWVPGGAAVPPAPDRVAVLGRVHSDQTFYSQTAAAGAGSAPTLITAAGLAQYWNRSTRAGYLVLAEQEPGLRPSDPQPVPPVFGASQTGGLPLQNLGYAAQWLVFVAFVWFMWWRWLREAARDAVAPARQALHSRPAPVGGSGPTP